MSTEVEITSPSRAIEPSATDPARRLLAAFLVGYEGHTRTAYEGHTRTAYSRDLQDWLAFCARHGMEPLAAHRTHVDAYARELAEVHGRARSTIARHCRPSPAAPCDVPVWPGSCVPRHLF